ncbi:MAG: hypothetical protein ACLU5J_11250 [Christensenellales bacterium]
MPQKDLENGQVIQQGTNVSLFKSVIDAKRRTRRMVMVKAYGKL